MESLPGYYRNPLQAASDVLNRQPQGELKPIDSSIYRLGSVLEDRIRMPDAGRVLQRFGTGSYSELDPAQAVRGATEVAMQVPQFKTTGTAVNAAGRALKPILATVARQGYRAALPQAFKAAPSLGNAAVEGLSLLGSVTDNPNLSEMATIARLGTRGLNAESLRRHIDIGEQGARNLAAARNNSNVLNQLAAAKRLYDRGMSNESVFKQTGWRQLPGQKGTEHWAYEISDDTARLKPNVQAGTLASQYTHPDLMDAYPEIGFLQRVANPSLPEGVAGKSRTDRLEYNPNLLTTPESQKRNLIHETQHWIQGTEGWPKGSSPKSQDALDYAAQQTRKEVGEQGLSTMNPTSLAELQKMLAIQHYYNQAGEAQARMAADRMNLTPMQRRSSFPRYDRTENELNYRY